MQKLVSAILLMVLREKKQSNNSYQTEGYQTFHLVSYFFAFTPMQTLSLFEYLVVGFNRY